MDNLFDEAFDYAMANEGGATCTDDPQDPGGVTKYGISKWHHPNVDVANLTEKRARKIYQECYWDVMECAQLARISPMIAVKVFDSGVNLGPRRAIIMLQEALARATGAEIGLDGTVGPKTLNALMRTPKLSDVMSEYITSLLTYYHSRPGWNRFGHGWGKRARKLPEVPWSAG